MDELLFNIFLLAAHVFVIVYAIFEVDLFESYSYNFLLYASAVLNALCIPYTVINILALVV